LWDIEILKSGLNPVATLSDIDISTSKTAAYFPLTSPHSSNPSEEDSEFGTKLPSSQSSTSPSPVLEFQTPLPASEGLAPIPPGNIEFVPSDSEFRTSLLKNSAQQSQGPSSPHSLVRIVGRLSKSNSCASKYSQ
jgi:hypothetical protein